MKVVRMLGGVTLAAWMCFAQTDPGPRGGPAGAGGPIAGLTAGEKAFFLNQATATFAEVEAVADGLGPRFNLDSCGGCHAFPALGGSSPATNPQVARAAAMAPGNAVPSFLSGNGPIREARFVKNPDGTPDGGVHGIFTISGRPDKPSGCSIQQPNFSSQVQNNNVIFRIPTPTFGTGLIEAITDTTIRNNVASDPFGMKARLGITGRVNTNGNDGTVTRFGWKAQNKSLLIFSGEAYNVEMGVTNENFPNEREEDARCATNGTPESDTGFNVGSTTASDIVAFMMFMKCLDQPAPVTSYGKVSTNSINNGRLLFTTTGCALCHTPTLTTGTSSSAALSNVKANLYSDLALHNMGSNLADGVSQGGAGPTEFRTAPLWGLGQRLFLLHDGRTSDLMQAIKAHASCSQAPTTTSSGCMPSEANQVIGLFNQLSNSQTQDLLNFLRSL
ncbi:MAG TPA: di-heme oxidoredictase family protein [Verrucomicrobiae bacterium]|nr:di-heme oxidoredictase family protein [Verrucomicrobiae bacterium]